MKDLNLVLPRIPDKFVTYYKITNKDEIHHGLKYHNGLVIDHQKFDDNPEHSCVAGGIYFTTKEHLHKFFSLGMWIRPITIPSDAKVVLDPGRDKYRADRLFFHPRKSKKLYFNKLFNKETFPKENYRYLAKDCSNHFDKWFDKETFPKNSYYYLAIYCSEHFDKWFDKRTFPKKYYWCLQVCCSKYSDKWKERLL